MADKSFPHTMADGSIANVTFKGGTAFVDGTKMNAADSATLLSMYGSPPEPTVASGLSQRALSDIVGPTVAEAAERDKGKIIALKRLYQFGSKPTYAGGEPKEGLFGTGVTLERSEAWDASEDPRFARYKGRLHTTDNVPDAIRLFSDMVNDENSAVSAFAMDRLDRLTTIINRGGNETPGVPGVSTKSGAGGATFIGNKKWWASPGGMHISLTPEKGSLQHRAASAQHGARGADELEKQKKKAKEQYENPEPEKETYEL